MTRDKAIECLKRHMPTLYAKHEFIDFCIEVGMLKVEEKTDAQKAIDALRKKDIGISAMFVISQLEKAGFEIVEKKK